MIFGRMIIARFLAVLTVGILAATNVFAKYRTNAEMKKIAGQIHLLIVSRIFLERASTLSLQLPLTNTVTEPQYAVLLPKKLR